MSSDSFSDPVFFPIYPRRTLDIHQISHPAAILPHMDAAHAICGIGTHVEAVHPPHARLEAPAAAYCLSCLGTCPPSDHRSSLASSSRSLSLDMYENEEHSMQELTRPLPDR